METKVCGACGDEKPMEAFAKARNMKSGRQSWCRACKALDDRQRREAMTPEQRARYNKRRSDRYDSDERRRYRAEKYDHVRRVERNSHLKRKYNITLEQFEEMLERQGGGCAICARPHVEHVDALHVDHDHKTGEVRGLLCHGCNVAIGLMQDDPDRMRAAIAYVLGQRLKDTLDLG